MLTIQRKERAMNLFESFRAVETGSIMIETHTHTPAHLCKEKTDWHDFDKLATQVCGNLSDCSESLACAALYILCKPPLFAMMSLVRTHQCDSLTLNNGWA